MGDEENEKVCKLVLIGESGVGKTCITNRFINDKFEDNQKSTGTAIFAAKTISFEKFEGKSIKFQIWDTAGQERYRALNRMFYKDAGAVILVYDVTNKESFEEIKEYWYNQIQEFAPKDISKKIFYFNFILLFLVLGLAGNKSDLYDKMEVKEEEAKDLSQEIGAIFRLTSALASSGIDELFKSIGYKLLDPNFKDDENHIESPGKDGTNTRGVKLEEQKDKNDPKKKKSCC